jgi:excisionase family DNA binding protein
MTNDPADLWTATAMAQDKTMTVAEAAKALGIPLGRIYRMIDRGQVRVVRNHHRSGSRGKAYRIEPSEIERLRRKSQS